MTTLTALLMLAGASAANADSPFTVEFQEIAPRVWVGIRPDAPRPPVMGNTVFVVSDEGVVVFDGGGMPAMSDQVIARIRSLTDRPVTHVVTSHWHGDHNFGIYRFAEEFADVKFIAHRFTRDMMQSSRLNYVDRAAGFADADLEAYKAIATTGVDADGKTYSDVERAFFGRIIDDSDAITAELPRGRVMAPNVVIDDRYIIDSGERRIELRFLGHGNTAGDIVMWLPAEKIVATGDIVVLPSPYAFNVPPRDWAQTLRNIQALDYEILVPGHGAVQRSADYVALLIDAADDTAGQSERLAAAGVAADEIADRIDLSPFADRFTGGSDYLRVTWDMWFSEPFRAAAAKALGDEPMVQVPPPEAVPFDDERWEYEAVDHEIVDYLGRTALRLKGGKAVLPDLAIRNGVIEFDIAVPDERGFAGAMFRYLDGRNYEHFYVRPHQSGNPDANQYQPVINGHAAWQLYHGPGYSAAVEYRHDAWMPVRIVFGGDSAEVYIDSAEPVLVVPALKRGQAAGAVGLQAADFAGVHFSNFRFTRLADAWSFPPPPPTAAAPGIVRHWEVSDSFSRDELDGVTRLDDDFVAARRFARAAAEPSGIVNIAAQLRATATGDTVFARLQVRADGPETRVLDFGFSDRAAVFVNRNLVYRGDNTYLSRDYRYLGTIGLFDSVALPLRAGDNEVLIAVSENFGGWGVIGRLPAPAAGKP